MINEFRGQYYFLSNFYEAPVEYEGIKYQNNEAAFQSAKVTDYDTRLQFANLNPSQAKSKGRHVTLRHGWELIKDDIMYEVCKAKFEQNEDLKAKLLATEKEELVEGNTWGDTYWGKCNDKGKNQLGKILMRIRGELK